MTRRIAVQADLLEEAVFLACRASAARGDPAPEAWRRRRLDRAYRLRDAGAAARRFARVNGALFRRLGLARAVGEVLRAHGLPPGQGGPVRVRAAPGPAAEGMEAVRPRDGGPPAVVALLLPATLADPAAVQRRLHRDARKIADLLDPAFAWAPEEPEPSPARRETVRARYGAAWDAWTDGRLARAGLPRPVPDAVAAVAFREVFGEALGEEACEAARLRLAGAPALRHADLLGAARDPCVLGGAGADLAAAAAAGPPATGRDTAGGRAGAPCPLCRFPTHDWEPDPAALPAPVRVALSGMGAAWSPGHGVCRQCAMIAAAAAREVAGRGSFPSPPERATAAAPGAV